MFSVGERRWSIPEKSRFYVSSVPGCLSAAPTRRARTLQQQPTINGGSGGYQSPDSEDQAYEQAYEKYDQSLEPISRLPQLAASFILTSRSGNLTRQTAGSASGRL